MDPRTDPIDEAVRTSAVRSLAWTATDGVGLERATVEMAEEGAVLRGSVVRDDEAVYRISYEVRVDARWTTRSVTVFDDETGRSLQLRSEGNGRWIDADGAPLDRLDGAVDVDISATPMTNTLPVRRLGLAIGESADIVTAYVLVTELGTDRGVELDAQRYTRTGELEYLYESRSSDFRRTVQVDEDGFVLEYQDAFRRTE
ncbi:putative glycolipid-binding domain-containing protein [Naasia lichenicola]|uniref:Glycolipid-binding domain-containing protein n=1 Tax=Naasia lichenicola TaxID=2565933 RepID=A0A4S4FT45_9MICO|nr:putative glycolipid-binding domain-containing protein [Naasia lichenicola]THG33498.1 hypothetical protein E6C64_03955 [Naasia lichenicola]